MFFYSGGNLQRNSGSFVLELDTDREKRFDIQFTRFLPNEQKRRCGNKKYTKCARES